MTAQEVLNTSFDVVRLALVDAWTIMTGNPVLVVYVGAGLLALGFNFFGRAKNTVE